MNPDANLQNQPDNSKRPDDDGSVPVRNDAPQESPDDSFTPSQNAVPDNTQPQDPIVAGAPETSPAPEPVMPVPPSAPAQGNGLAIAALVLGIVAFAFSWLSLLNLPASIAAVALGIVALNKHQSKGMSLTGLILGVIGLLASIAWFVFALLIGSASTSP